MQILKTGRKNFVLIIGNYLNVCIKNFRGFLTTACRTKIIFIYSISIAVQLKNNILDLLDLSGFVYKNGMS